MLKYNISFERRNYGYRVKDYQHPDVEWLEVYITIWMKPDFIGYVKMLIVKLSITQITKKNYKI
jgi:hypothetical protein